MSKTAQLMIGCILAASLVLAVDARAADLRSVACSVTIDYSLNDVVQAPYQRDFVIEPGVLFEDDFSTPTRLRVFDASTRLEADNKTTTVSISYFNDVGVFESVDLRTELKIHNDRAPESTSGTNTYSTSLGIAGNHTTAYVLTCGILKN